MFFLFTEDAKELYPSDSMDISAYSIGKDPRNLSYTTIPGLNA